MKSIAAPDGWGDVRAGTHATRVKIGFGQGQSLEAVWPEADAVYNDDTLKIEGHPVMERWEDGYMRVLAAIAGSRRGLHALLRDFEGHDVDSPVGPCPSLSDLALETVEGARHVLEVGYGMGISAGYLREQLRPYASSKHHIIEANQQVAERAEAFAEEYPGYATIVRKGLWQDVIGEYRDGSLDAILFDSYPLNPKEVHGNHFPFLKEAYRLLRKGGVFTYYSDEINDFSSQHIEALKEVGFSRNRIGGLVVRVSPPADCQYWTSPTILAPIVVK